MEIFVGSNQPATIYGKSTDTKPTDVTNGTSFYEVDTKKVYIFYEGEWFEQ